MTSIYPFNKIKFNSFLNKNINIPDCEEKTKSYIVNILTDISPQNDLSKQSITLIYQKAIRFNEFQQLGDWLFFTKSLFPESLHGAAQSYYDMIAQKSYYKCYVLLNRQWALFEELAEHFSVYTYTVRNSLRKAPDFSLFGNGLL